MIDGGAGGAGQEREDIYSFKVMLLLETRGLETAGSGDHGTGDPSEGRVSS